MFTRYFQFQSVLLSGCSSVSNQFLSNPDLHIKNFLWSDCLWHRYDWVYWARLFLIHIIILNMDSDPLRQDLDMIPRWRFDTCGSRYLAAINLLRKVKPDFSDPLPPLFTSIFHEEKFPLFELSQNLRTPSH